VNNEQPKQLVIPLATAEAVVNYLAQRPYVEVFQLIAAMQQLQPLPVPVAEEVKE
jgi:hypothetical protein